jgi:hypothetical protein
LRLRNLGPLVLLGATLVGPCSAQNRDSDIKLMTTSSGDRTGNTTEYWASAEAVKASPQWRPDSEDSPLPILEAVRIARDAVKKQHPKYDDVVFWSLQVMQVSAPGVDNRWLYFVSFHPVVDGEKMSGGNASAIVLLDGTLAEVRSVKKSR